MIQIDMEQSTASATSARFTMQEDRLDTGGQVVKTLGSGIVATGNFLEVTIDVADSAGIVGADQISRKMSWQAESNLGSGNRPVSGVRLPGGSGHNPREAGRSVHPCPEAFRTGRYC